jgi:hypothetical protein
LAMTKSHSVHRIFTCLKVPCTLIFHAMWVTHYCSSHSWVFYGVQGCYCKYMHDCLYVSFTPCLSSWRHHGARNFVPVQILTWKSYGLLEHG